MRLLWLTRGRDWGQRFVRDDCESDPADDPLLKYETAFAPITGEREGLARAPEGVAVRFADPLGRRDHSGRTIVHDVLVYPPDDELMASFDQARELVWREIRGEYSSLYLTEGPPRL